MEKNYYKIEKKIEVGIINCMGYYVLFNVLFKKDWKIISYL